MLSIWLKMLQYVQQYNGNERLRHRDTQSAKDAKCRHIIKNNRGFPSHSFFLSCIHSTVSIFPSSVCKTTRIVVFLRTTTSNSDKVQSNPIQSKQVKSQVKSIRLYLVKKTKTKSRSNSNSNSKEEARRRSRNIIIKICPL